MPEHVIKFHVITSGGGGSGGGSGSGGGAGSHKARSGSKEDDDRYKGLFGSIAKFGDDFKEDRKEMGGVVAGTRGLGKITSVASQIPATLGVPGAGVIGGLGGMAASVTTLLAIPAVAAAIAAAGMYAIHSYANSQAQIGGEYNPAIATANAMAEVEKVRGDMKRSEYLAPELSDFVQAQSKMSESWEDLKAVFGKALIPVLTKIFDLVGKGLEWFVEADIAILERLDNIFTAIEESLPDSFSDTKEMLRQMAENARQSAASLRKMAAKDGSEEVLGIDLLAGATKEWTGMAGRGGMAANAPEVRAAAALGQGLPPGFGGF